MPPSYITIPLSEYRSLLREVKRGVEVCGEVADLRVLLVVFEKRISGAEKMHVKQVIESCEDVSRLRTELAALERRLKEFEGELTPIRPPSRTDIQAAFENSVDFASGRKKPPEKG